VTPKPRVKPLPMVQLTCKNHRCRKTFAADQGAFQKMHGKATCDHCKEQRTYDIGDAKLIKGSL
jgi:hypothetical protein